MLLICVERITIAVLLMLQNDNLLLSEILITIEFIYYF